MAPYYRKYSRSAKGKATQSRRQKTEKRKISTARHKRSEKFALTTEKYQPRKKELRKRDYIRIHSDIGLNLEHGLGVKISQMVKRVRKDSETVMSYSEFEDSNDLCAHLASTFEPGMTFENFGKHAKDGPKVWNVGHRIARSLYDNNNPVDIRRCWSKKNLFAQWAAENISLGTKLPSTEILLGIVDVWPIAWNGLLPIMD